MSCSFLPNISRRDIPSRKPFSTRWIPVETAKMPDSISLQLLTVLDRLETNRPHKLEVEMLIYNNNKYNKISLI